MSPRIFPFLKLLKRRCHSWLFGEVHWTDAAPLDYGPLDSLCLHDIKRTAPFKQAIFTALCGEYDGHKPDNCEWKGL